MKNFVAYIIFIAVALPAFAQERIAEGSETYRLIEQAVQHIYNMKLEEANALSERINTLAPGHPVYPILKALAIRTAAYPIDLESEDFKTMRGYLDEAVEKSEKMLDKDEDQPEANFFALSAYGMLAMYENQDGSAFKAVGLAKNAYKYLKKGFKLKEKYPEFYFSTGLYNYYREKYPELHPIYKTFMWFFRSGDMQLGLEQMKKATQTSVFMAPEARDYLQHIYLRYENKPEASLTFAKALLDQYPDNLYFVFNYIDSSLAAASYEGLDPLIERLIESDKSFYQMLGQIFRATLLEKRDQQWDEAEAFYVKSLGTGYGLQTEDAENYRSYAYAGLARIALHEEKPVQAKKLYQQSLAAAQYPQTKKEAEAYLD